MAEHVPGKAFAIGQSTEAIWDDLSLADRIAQVVLAVPGVCSMSQGRFTRAVTYGPGGQVPGVVLWRLAPGKLLIEVHIVIHESVLLAAFQQRPTKASAQPSILLDLAEHIRLAVQQVVMGLPLFPHAIDVVIEDTC